MWILLLRTANNGTAFDCGLFPEDGLGALLSKMKRKISVGKRLPVSAMICSISAVVWLFQTWWAVEDLVMGGGPRIPTWKSLTCSEKSMHVRRCGSLYLYIYQVITQYHLYETLIGGEASQGRVISSLEVPHLL